MGYEPAIIVRRLRDALSRKPGQTLHSIADDLKVERHTIRHALKRIEGVSFGDLQAEFMRAALDRLQRRDEPLFKKQIADELGLRSTRALRHWLGRLGFRSESVPR